MSLKLVWTGTLTSGYVNAGQITHLRLGGGGNRWFIGLYTGDNGTHHLGYYPTEAEATKRFHEFAAWLQDPTETLWKEERDG